MQIKIDKPVGNDDSITTTVDKAVSDQLQATDPNSSDTLTFGIVDQPAHGTVTLTDVNKGTFTYTPAAGYAGADNFTFMLNNGYVDSNTATESVTVATAATSGSQPSSNGSGGSGSLGFLSISALSFLTALSLRRRRQNLEN